MTEPEAILDIDLPRFESGDESTRRAVVDGTTRSLATGFVYAKHDIPSEEIDRAYALLADFFALSQEKKDACVVEGSMGQTGYTGLLVETAAGAESADWKEMLNWGQELPAGHPLMRAFPHRYMPRRFDDEAIPGMSATLGLLWDRLLDLQKRVLRIIALGLGAHEHYFDALLEDGPTLARAIRYPAMKDAPDPNHEWAGAHADINLITALPRATAKGLEVQVGDTWVPAAPPPGHAIINTGMMLELVSNGRIPSGIHRVVAGEDASEERLSVVQFCHPTPRTILSPLASCITPETPQRHAPVQAGDWLDQVLWDINLM